MKRSAAVVAALCAVAAVLAAPRAARATTTTYYVDCAAGNDGNSGTSTAAAWRTLTKASSVVYGPGDQILLKRGCVFAGQSFVAQGSGSVSARIVLADYGTGDLPRIDASNAEAVKLQNVQNWTVKNLDLTQHGQEPEAIDANNEHGKDRDKSTDTFMHPVVLVRGLGPTGVQACGEPCTVRNITLDGLRVHDGTWTGIFVEGGYYDLGDNTYGYADNVVIQNSEAWGNHKAGIEFTDTYTKDVTYNDTNVKVLSSWLHHNGGDGIMMGPVDHGLIDSNRCSYNGWERNARLGCWSWDSHDVVSQFNESDHNQTPLNDSHARDAGGFDLDLGTEDSVMQYDWSHDNQGEGFLLMTWPIGFGYNRGVTHNAQLRYSISERDAKKLGTSVFVFGGTQPAWIYNNTVYYESARDTASAMYQAEGGALGLSKYAKSGTPQVNVDNNLFIGNGTVAPGSVDNLVRDEAGCTCTYDRNLYYRVEGGFRANLNGTVLTTFAGWQAKGYDPNGKNLDPQVTGPLGGGPSAYQLQPSSPAIDMAQPVNAPRGMGSRDYFGDATPNGAAYDTGFDEYAGVTSPVNSWASPPGHLDVGGAVHVADIWTTNASGTPTSTFAKGAPVYWKVKVVDATGQAVPGVVVRTRVFGHDWSWLQSGSLSATSDANGVAAFSGTADSFSGANNIVLTGVTPPGTTYYDSSYNAKFIQAYTVG
jgi:hypothetical protein